MLSICSSSFFLFPFLLFPILKFKLFIVPRIITTSKTSMFFFFVTFLLPFLIIAFISGNYIYETTNLVLTAACSYMEARNAEFNLGIALEAVMSQVMPSSQESQVQLIQNLPADLSSMYVYGDNLRLQQVLSDFLTVAVRFTPAFSGSSVMFMVNPSKESLGTKMQLLHVEFR